MNLIPSHRPVIGEDLDTLREMLGLSTMDAIWLYGMSMNKWTNTVKNGARSPVDNITLALLARQLAAHPELCPLPKPVGANDVYSLIQTLLPSLDKKRFAIMFGCEASSGYRWITMGSKISPALSRLFFVFQTILKSARKRSESQALSMLTEWDQMVENEANQRGVRNVFSSGRWVCVGGADIRRPVIGQDLDELREELGLSTMDACWLFGMSMTKWSKIVNKDGRVPVSNVSLALLVRALRAYPQACPIFPSVSAFDVKEQIDQTVRRHPNHEDGLIVDKKRMGIMFGCEASAGYRWLTTSSKISPVLVRLFYVFHLEHGLALEKSRANMLRAIKKAQGSAQNGTDLPSTDDGHQEARSDALMLDSWDEMVLTEARVRGIENVFSTGRWVPKNLLGQ